ncbi:exportin-7-like isoform X2 [Oscarella lobularis]|uniref:exportin-7-like isoform X2 n=1 Tax=Oscarella lobularis TaxID=121494 RepID=UPI0033130D0E
MDDQHVPHIESLCHEFYSSTDPRVRAEAEKSLVLFTETVENVAKCQTLLERAQNPAARLIAANALNKLISKPTSPVTMSGRLETRNYLMSYLFQRPKETPYVMEAIVKVIAKLTKISWFDVVDVVQVEEPEFVFRNIVSEIKTFLQSSVEQGVVGVHILLALVNDMNQSEVLRSLTWHRKIAASFRETQLLSIFQLSISLLKEGCGKRLSENQLSLLGRVLGLAKSCLSFDFIGTSSDETSDDFSSAQIPTAWRPDFLDSSTVNVFFDLYLALPPSFASIALSCLVLITSVRRSLFTAMERQAYLNTIMQGIKKVLSHPEALVEVDNYHEFCRLLARLKANYQLGELMQVENYGIIIEMIAKFTVSSLQSWQFSANSIHYLLNLWQRLVASICYVTSSEPHLLENYAPEITKTFLHSRLESVAVVIRDNLDDPLDDLSLVQQQLDQMCTIGRCDYSGTCHLVASYFDTAASAYQQCLTQGSSTNDIRLYEGQLAWLVYFIGAVIGGRVSYSYADDEDGLDGELIIRVLQLMNLTDRQLEQGGGCERLELAILSFFEQFRKIYIGDQFLKAKVYSALGKRLGISNESMLLTLCIQKIITNMKFWSNSESIVQKTLHFFHELSVGYSSARKLIKLDCVQMLLQNHSPENLPFLAVRDGSHGLNFRCRTTFYTALSRLLMIDLGEEDEKFVAFMTPIAATFQKIGSQLISGEAVYSESELKFLFIGLCCDLRGVVSAIVSRPCYSMFFDWIYPNYFPVLQRALQLWCHDPSVTTPILRLASELVNNKQQRLLFDISSPNGILLFREVSKILVSHGTAMITLTDVPQSEIFAMKYKGVAISFLVLKLALSGHFVNFGVFGLYNDSALSDCLDVFIKVVLSIPANDLVQYPKLSTAYFGLLDTISQDHMNFMAGLDAQVLAYVLSSVNEGIAFSDVSVSTACCSMLDAVLTHLFRKLSKVKKHEAVADHSFLRLVDVQPEVFQQMLSTVLNIIIFEECRNQWSMSRPLLGLVLLNEKYFENLRDSLVNMQSGEKRELMKKCFQGLMAGVERNLLPKNRDKFTQNLSVFRKDVNSSWKDVPPVVVPASGVTSTDMMS